MQIELCTMCDYFSHHSLVKLDKQVLYATKTSLKSTLTFISKGAYLLIFVILCCLLFAHFLRAKSPFNTSIKTKLSSLFCRFQGDRVLCVLLSFVSSRPCVLYFHNELTAALRHRRVFLRNPFFPRSYLMTVSTE